MKCHKCNGSVIKLVAKCYDNLTITATRKYVGPMGYEYDGRELTISYCADCGVIQGDLPTVEREIIAPPVVETNQKLIENLIGELRRHDFNECNLILQKLSTRIPPMEYDQLLELYSVYLDAFRIAPEMPELFNTLMRMRSTY